MHDTPLRTDEQWLDEQRSRGGCQGILIARSWVSLFPKDIRLVTAY
jgi:hypothetical protein